MSVFEQVKDALNIRQVVEFYGTKVNRNGQFICPFHNDTRPSASIKNDYFNCFVCGTAGDLISYTAKLFVLSNLDACKKLNDDFKLGLSFGPDTNACRTSRLRADRERQKRLQAKREREELEELTRRTGRILSEYHCYLWQGVNLYHTSDKRHIRGLQRLTEAQYYLECYDSEPEKYSVEQRKGVKEIEKRLYRWNNER
jgi:hypothetical protein